MTTTFFKAFALCAALASTATVQAKTYGGYKPGRTFELKVVERSSVKKTAFDKDKNQPIPSGIPNFKKKQVVKFTIGKKGQLTAKGMSIGYETKISRGNYYESGESSYSKDYNAYVYKRAGNYKPRIVVLTFKKTSGFGFFKKERIVRYELE